MGTAVRPAKTSPGPWDAANASRTRLAVSLIRTAIFGNRSRMVENSPLAGGWGLGIASRIVRTSQNRYGAICRLSYDKDCSTHHQPDRNLCRLRSV
jgi:hypothetical protein